MKMEQIECSKTSAYNNQTPGKYPKEYIQIPCTLWDWKFHQHVYNSLPLVCILSDESKHNLPPYFLKNLQSTLVLKTNIFFQTFQPKPCMCFISLSHVPHAQHINIWKQLSEYCTERQQSYNDPCVTNVQWDIISGLYKSHNIPSYWKS
jgi:hypothetical protein